MKTVLFICTSCRFYGKEENGATGMWLSEFADACHCFSEHGYRVVAASPAGGSIPLDPQSTGIWTGRAEKDPRLHYSTPLDEIDPNDFDAVFYPGGHGTFWDLFNDKRNARLVSAFFDCGKVIGAVCHGPAALLKSRRRDGYPVIHERRLTGLSDVEEQESGKAHHLPFSLESSLRASGAYYSCRPSGTEYVVTDGNLVTGQNSASATAVAEMMTELMRPAEMRKLSTPALF